MKKSKKIKNKINSILNFKINLIKRVIPISLLVIFIISCFIYFRYDFLTKMKIAAATQNLETKLKLKESELKDYKKETKVVLEIRDRYRSSIKEMVDMIYHKDMAVGGTLGDIPETDEITLLHLKNVVQSMDDDMKLMEEAKNYLVARKEFAENFPFIWPIKIEGQPTISSHFGLRKNSETGQIPLDGFHFHAGIDLIDDFRSPIVATADGKVVYVDGDNEVYGKVIDLQHKYEFLTRYGHLDEILVQYGEQVKRGQIIGYMGQTGKSFGVHLHYEIRTNGVAIDPLTFLSMDY
jgi:murein DD-endopeptidase MepM/ murein hydrolase activator NlpD